RLSHDDDTIDALARLSTREGYRPLQVGLGVVRPVLAYPELDEFVGLALRTLIDDPEVDDDGGAAEQWREVSRALALEMASLTPDEPLPAGQRSTLEVTRDLLFRQNDAFGDAPRWSLVRDSRGLALPAAGSITSPFVDGDADGLADVDEN